MTEKLANAYLPILGPLSNYQPIQVVKTKLKNKPQYLIEVNLNLTIKKGEKLANNIQITFKEKYDRFQKSRGYHGTVSTMMSSPSTLPDDPVELKKIIAVRDADYHHIKILASGGIHKENAKEYASCNLDGIITSKIYSCGIANLGTKLYME